MRRWRRARGDATHDGTSPCRPHGPDDAATRWRGECGGTRGGLDRGQRLLSGRASSSEGCEGSNRSHRGPQSVLQPADKLGFGDMASFGCSSEGEGDSTAST